MGACKCKSSKIREALNWALQHESTSTVRIQAIHSALQLGLIQEDQLIKHGVLTLLTSDGSEKVRKEAEKALVIAGIIFPSIGTDEGKNDTRMTVDGQSIGPYPHLLGDKMPQEIEIYLRNSLIGEKEIVEVIDQVHKLSTKDAVMSHVEDMNSSDIGVNRLDLQYDASFLPSTYYRKQKKEKSKNLRLDRNGIPQLN